MVGMMKVKRQYITCILLYTESSQLFIFYSNAEGLFQDMERPVVTGRKKGKEEWGKVLDGKI